MTTTMAPNTQSAAPATSGYTQHSTSKKSNKKPKDPKRCTWKENYANPLLSGIEFRQANSNACVHFITIQHKELLNKDNAAPFRVTVQVSDDLKIQLPRKKTFEEMIQAKRRQQNILYGPGNPSTTSTSANTSSVLSDRAARRVTATARRQSVSARRPTSSRRVVQEAPAAQSMPSTSRTSSRRSSGSRSKSKKKKTKPSRPSDSRRPAASRVPVKPTSGFLNNANSLDPLQYAVPSTSAANSSLASTSAILEVPSTSARNNSPAKLISKPFEVKTSSDDIPTDNKAVHMISSMKELARQNPSLGTMDKKEIKRLLKSAPPGAALVLANGTVIKKSRRGGARAGAGRKRSRPLPNGQQSSTTLDSSTQQDSRSSSTSQNVADNDASRANESSVIEQQASQQPNT